MLGLRPVLKRFVQAFEKPSDEDLKEFWGSCVIRHRGSGLDYISNWLSAFCYFNGQGKVLSPYQTMDQKDSTHWLGSKGGRTLIIDGVRYGIVRTHDIPASFVRVPVTCVEINGTEHQTEMAAGNVAVRKTSSGLEMEDGTIGVDTLKPEMGWWIYDQIDGFLLRAY